MGEEIFGYKCRDEESGGRGEGKVAGDTKAPLGGHWTVIKGIFVEFDEEGVSCVADGAKKGGLAVGHLTDHLPPHLLLLLAEDAVTLSQN